MALTKAFALGAADSASGSSQTTATFNSTGYTHLVVFTKHEGATTTITPSDNKSSTGWTSQTKVSNRAVDSWGQFHWVKIGSPGTGHTVTITLGAARAFRTIIVWLVNASTTGEIAVDAAAQAASPSDNTAVDAGTLSTSGASVVSFMGVAEWASAVYTAGTGWTEDYDPNGPTYTYGQSRGPETTTPIDPACTSNTAQDWAACAVSFLEGTASGPAPGAGTVTLTGGSSPMDFRLTPRMA